MGYDTLYVNLLGASGAGKSTMAARLLAGMKVTELVRERVKEMVV